MARKAKAVLGERIKLALVLRCVSLIEAGAGVLLIGGHVDHRGSGRMAPADTKSQGATLL